jgi:hypothetical protein
MKCLRLLKHRGHEFESHSRHGCLFAFILCLCSPMYVAALRQADPPSKKSYRFYTSTYKIKKLKEAAWPKLDCKAISGGLCDSRRPGRVIDHADRLWLLSEEVQLQSQSSLLNLWYYFGFSLASTTVGCRRILEETSSSNRRFHLVRSWWPRMQNTDNTMFRLIWEIYFIRWHL